MDQQQQQQPFDSRLSGRTRVSQYQNSQKHTTSSFSSNSSQAFPTFPGLPLYL